MKCFLFNPWSHPLQKNRWHFLHFPPVPSYLLQSHFYTFLFNNSPFLRALFVFHGQLVHSLFFRKNFPVSVEMMFLHREVVVCQTLSRGFDVVSMRLTECIPDCGFKAALQSFISFPWPPPPHSPFGHKLLLNNRCVARGEKYQKTTRFSSKAWGAVDIGKSCKEKKNAAFCFPHQSSWQSVQKIKACLLLGNG